MKPTKMTDAARVLMGMVTQIEGICDAVQSVIDALPKKHDARGELEYFLQHDGRQELHNVATANLANADEDLVQAMTKAGLLPLATEPTAEPATSSGTPGETAMGTDRNGTPIRVGMIIQTEHGTVGVVTDIRGNAFIHRVLAEDDAFHKGDFDSHTACDCEVIHPGESASPAAVSPSPLLDDVGNQALYFAAMMERIEEELTKAAELCPRFADNFKRAANLGDNISALHEIATSCVRKDALEVAAWTTGHRGA